MSELLTHYRIPEIPLTRFYHLLEGIYRVLEIEHVTQELDPLYEIILRNHKKLNESQCLDIIDLNQEKLNDNIALLHYDLATCFPGWARIGRYSDLVNLDNNQILVWKSPFAVERTSMKLLQDFRISGKMVYMVGFGSTEFENLSVKEAYYLLSGRVDFWDDLKATLTYIFTTYKTYSALREAMS